ncbi:MAG: hypothetical protein IPJ55_17005 [Chloracidobacterium sp.]|nr:hypothetical protein [Chloracidobacterium sp.]
MSNENLKGYMDEIRVTKGGASNSHHASWQGWRLRLALLLGAIKNLFTGKGVWLSGSVQMNVGTPGISEMKAHSYTKKGPGRQVRKNHKSLRERRGDPTLGNKMLKKAAAGRLTKIH